MGTELTRMPDMGVQLPALPAGVTGDASLLASSRTRLLTSLDSKNPDDMQRFFSSQNDSDLSGRDAIGNVFAVEHFLIRDVTRTSFKTGELEPALRLTLIGPAGETFSTTSDICIQSFMLLCAVRGYPPWKPARELRVHGIKTRNGMMTYKLVENVAVPSKTAGSKQGK